MEFLCTEHNCEWIFSKVMTFLHLFAVVLGEVSSWKL